MDHRQSYSPRERVQRAIRHEVTDRLPKGELCITEAVINRALHCLQVGFEEKLAFTEQLGLDIFTLAPVCSCEKNKLPEPGDVKWPGIEKWTVETSLYTFIIVDGAFETGMRTFTGLKFMVLAGKASANLLSFIAEVEKLNMALFREAAAKGVNGVILADDVAFNGGMMISPQSWRECFLPSLARQVEEINRLGLAAFYHSDGNYLEIIPDLITVHFQGLQCLEERCGMDMADLQEEYGEHICLWGHIDSEDTFKVQDPGYLQVLTDNLQKLSRCRGLILGTNSGLYEGMDIGGLKAIYRSLE